MLCSTGARHLTLAMNWVANLIAMLCSKGPGIFRCNAAQNPTLQSIAIHDPLSFRIGPSGRSLSLNMKWLLFQLPQLSQRSV